MELLYFLRCYFSPKKKKKLMEIVLLNLLTNVQI